MYLTIDPTLSTYIASVGRSPVTKLIQKSHPKRELDYLKVEESRPGVMISYLEAKDFTTAIGDVFGSTLRKTAKLGRFLNKINDGSCTEDMIRSFVEEMTAIVKGSAYEVKIIEGDDIVTAYRTQREDCSPAGGIGTRIFGSCFQGVLTKKQCEFWRINPEIVKMITVYLHGKLDGRALIWFGKDRNDKDIIHLDNMFGGTPQGKILMNKKAKEIGAKRYPTGEFQTKGSVASMPPYFDYVRHVGDGVIKSH